ncbi:hypothetical protein [uncultured Draconibacterium sp.]|uniref:hypothetical protein n=1 Tax=uncultured Draconibacterium sp. TaxID=1573823 RepID=UPI0025FF5FDC|nr:hypothetical protein [uncultured Draconibacterium sp.]
MIKKQVSESAIGGFNSLQYCKVSNIAWFPYITTKIEVDASSIVVTGDGWQDIDAVAGTISPDFEKKDSDAGPYFANKLQCRVHENNPDVINELNALREKVILRYNNNRGRTIIMGTKEHPLKQLFNQPAAPGIQDFSGVVITFSGQSLTPPLQIKLAEEE